MSKAWILARKALACVASVSVGLVLPARKMPGARAKKRKEGEGEGKEGNACRQTPGF